MSVEEVMNYAAWVVAIILLAYMVIDALRVEVTYDRDLLVSSVEGEIEKEILAHDEEEVLKKHAADVLADKADVEGGGSPDVPPSGGGS